MADQRSTNILRLVIDHNPFFLLSAICMMFGCHLLNLALYTPAGEIQKLLVLLGVINIYEAALIGLGLALLRQPGLMQRDAQTLMGLESLFLADSTFVSGVISTIDARSGWMLSAALLALCVLKISVVARALRLPRAGRIIVVVVIQVLVLLSIPPVFKQIAMSRRGFLPELAVYAAWWVAGLLPVIGAALLWPRRVSNEMPIGKSEQILAGVYLGVPFISAVVHVYGAGWVYNFYLAPAEIAPLLLGFAVAVGALRQRVHEGTILQWQVVLLAAALLSSLSARSGMEFRLLDMQVTPLRLTLLGAGLVIVHIIWLHSRIYALIAAMLSIAGVAVWPNLPAIWALLVSIARVVGSTLSRLVPKTLTQWGITCVVAAFVLLGAGTAFSLRRRPCIPPEREPGPPDQPKDEGLVAEETRVE